MSIEICAPIEYRTQVTSELSRRSAVTLDSYTYEGWFTLNIEVSIFFFDIFIFIIIVF